MFHKVVLRRATNRQFYFTVHADNSQILVTSETYKTKQGAENGLKSLMKVFGCTSVIINDTTKQEAKAIFI